MFLESQGATEVGDFTGSGSDEPQESAWAKGLFNRITTGGPNGTMAGKIAVNFMSNVPVSGQNSFDFSSKKLASFADDPENPFVKIIKRL